MSTQHDTQPINLTEYRRKILGAKLAHPAYRGSPELIWTPADSITTAQDFAAWADHTETGRPSRTRRAWITAAAALIALAIAGAATANADGQVDAWQAEYGPAACSVLDQHPTINALSGVIDAAENHGLTAAQAGEAAAASVLDFCPRHTDLLRMFVARFGPQQVTL